MSPQGAKPAKPLFEFGGPDDPELVTGKGFAAFVLIMAVVGGVLALFHDTLGKSGTLVILWSSSLVVIAVQFGLKWRAFRRRRQAVAGDDGSEERT